jgi:hypothetical protein
MALFIDFHEDLKLAPGAIAQITEHTRTWRADQFGVRQVELDHDARGQVYCLLEGPEEQAIRAHHVALAVPCVKASRTATGATALFIVTLAGLPDHAVEVICAPVPAPGSLSLGCHRGPLRCSQQTRPGRKP